jgi:hypothetical protein
MKSVLKKTAATACTILLGLGTFSCNDNLLNPTSQITLSDQVVFSNPARIGLQLQGLYSYVKAGNLLGGRAQVYGDIRANDFLNRTNNAVTGLTVWNHTETETSSNDVVAMWGAGYAAINQINVFLTGLDANAASFVAPTFPSTFATTSLNYQGEARLLRALCYYTLLQFYARPYTDGAGSRPGLPLRLAGDTGGGSNDLARSTVGDVYTQILADLNFAEQNLPLTYGTSFDNVTRAHRNTAIALKTRVYLTMGQYDNRGAIYGFQRRTKCVECLHSCRLYRLPGNDREHPIIPLHVGKHARWPKLAGLLLPAVAASYYCTDLQW